MKFTWITGREPDKHGGWTLDCYIMDEGRIKIATINMSGSFKEFKSSVNKFHVEIINCDDMYNMGIVNQNYFSSSLEGLKKLVEEKFERLKAVILFESVSTTAEVSIKEQLAKLSHLHNFKLDSSLMVNSIKE